MFQWLGYAFSCPKIVPLVKDDDATWSYHCRILDFTATAERERIHELAANVSCTLYEGNNNSTLVFSGIYVVPTRSTTRDHGGVWWEPGVNGKEWLSLERPTLVLNDSTCFREADTITLLEHGESPQFCPDFNPDQPLGCCIGRVEKLVHSYLIHMWCLSAAGFGVWLFFRYVVPRVFAGYGGRYGGPTSAKAEHLV